MSAPAGTKKNAPRPNWVSTRNPCKACAPLGAALVMRGIAGALPFLHGSQGCATYMRRYIISHFREPMDIATSGFSEASTIFGGGENLRQGLGNVTSQYHPALIGIATTCLTETIGEDMHGLLHEYRAKSEGTEGPLLVHVSTPSYSGTHIDGFNDAVRAVVEQLAEAGASASAYVGQFCESFPRAGLGGGFALSEGSGRGFRHTNDALSGLLGDAGRAVDGQVQEDSRRRYDDCGAARDIGGESQHRVRSNLARRRRRRRHRFCRRSSRCQR